MSKIKITILGGRGWLANRFYDLFDKKKFDVTLSTCPIDEGASTIKNFLESPDVIINCAGKTGRPNIDWCEENKEETFAANTYGAFNVAKYAKIWGIRLVHLSSGCIFQSPSPKNGYTEESPPRPTNFYSKTKVWADQIIQEICPNALIARIRMPIDLIPHDRNLITKVLKYKKVIDDDNSVTFVPDLSRALQRLILNGSEGIFNIVNPGTISPLDIVLSYKNLVDKNSKFFVLLKHDLDKITKAVRSSCVLSCSKLINSGISMIEMNEGSLGWIMLEYKKNLKS